MSGFIKMLYKILLFLAVVFMAGMLGCKTVKTSVKGREEMKRNVEQNTVALKAATRERNVLRYWPDGRVYQFEQLREQMDELELSKLEVKEKGVLKKEEVRKEREPLKVWVYAGIVLACVLMLGTGLWFYRIIK